MDFICNYPFHTDIREGRNGKNIQKVSLWNKVNKVQGTTLKIKKSLFESLQNVQRLINAHIFF